MDKNKFDENYQILVKFHEMGMDWETIWKNYEFLIEGYKNFVMKK